MLTSWESWPLRRSCPCKRAAGDYVPPPPQRPRGGWGWGGPEWRHNTQEHLPSPQQKQCSGGCYSGQVWVPALRRVPPHVISITHWASSIDIISMILYIRLPRKLSFLKKLMNNRCSLNVRWMNKIMKKCFWKYAFYGSVNIRDIC